MSAQPEKKPDDLLRAYAARRREQTGVPTEMDPATRKRLLAEVARNFPGATPANEERSSWFSLFWPRFAAVGSLLGLMLALIVWFRPPSDVANRSTETLPQLNPSTAPLSSPLPAPDHKGKENNSLSESLAKEATATELEHGPNSRAALSPALPQPTTESPSADGSEQRGLSAPLQLSVSSPSEPDPVNAEQPARDAADPEIAVDSTASLNHRPIALPASAAALADAVEETAANVARFHFTRSQPATRMRQNFNSPPRPEILNSFSVEQTGDQLRIVDADGSIYSGTLFTRPPGETAPAPVVTVAGGQAGATRRSRPRETPVRIAAANAEAAQFRFVGFRVEGTNLTLNQPVSVTGRMSVATSENAMRLMQASGPTTNQDRRAITNIPSRPMLLHNVSVIEGKAIIDRRQELQINATPVRK